MSEMEKRNRRLLQELAREYKCGKDGKNKRERFMYDGAISYSDYEKATRRVVFLLKDANEQSEGWALSQIPDLKEYSETGEIKWGKKIIPRRLCLMYEVIVGEKYEDKHKYLREVAYVNVKKDGGESQCYKSVLNKYAKAYGEYLLRQLKGLEPDIIVCGGTFEALVREIMQIEYKAGARFEDKTKEKGYFTWHIGTKNVKIVNMFHPSYTRKGYWDDKKYISEFKKRLG